jgi:polysaccharide export outer membrane protein
MRNIFFALILILFQVSPILAQSVASTEPSGLSPEGILLRQALNRQDAPNSSQRFNERMQSRIRLPKKNMDYLLGPGDILELTVVGIPGLDKKACTLDAYGYISVPYLGQIEIQGLTVQETESKLAKLFAASLLEDPQVAVSMKEYKSQFYYVMGAVTRPGKYSLVQSEDILDALATAGGLRDRAESKIRLHRNNSTTNVEAKTAGSQPYSNSMEINLVELLEGGSDNSRVYLQNGDVIEVREFKEKSYYVLGDIVRPGAFLMNSSKKMVLSQALANAGGMLKTASGKKVTIIRNKDSEALPEKLQVDAYALLRGEIKDVELLENDIVLVPGSASKTLSRSFLGSVSSLLTTLVIIGVR